MRYPRILRVAELVQADPAAVRSALVLPRSVTPVIVSLPAGTLVTLELRRPWWDRRPRARVLQTLNDALGTALALQRSEVVAAAVLRQGRMLAAQRGHPAELAGQWEFPGGKVERGESHVFALARECREELGVEIRVGAQLATAELPGGARLILFEAALIDADAEPIPVEHLSLRWVDPNEAVDLDWLAANREFLIPVTQRLSA